MKKLVLFFAVFAFALAFTSCSGGNKKQAANPEELEYANEVINYYHTSLKVLKGMVQEKDVNAVLGYMEQNGKAPMIAAIAPPAVSAKDTALLMNPGDYFEVGTQETLTHTYEGLFHARNQFYANFDTFLSYIKAKKFSDAGKLLDTNYDLSIQMTDYKQDIFDILGPLTEQAEQLLLANEPMKEQLIAEHKMGAAMQSILNLYARPHVMKGVRLDVKMEELRKELAAAKKLPAVKGHEKDVKSYQEFLRKADNFLKAMQEAIDKGSYNEDVYNSLITEYGLAII